MSLSPGGPDLASLSSLDDPLRRRLYEVVTSQPEPVSRDEAASAAGIGRALAVYHLDKLVESGLLTAFLPEAARAERAGGWPARQDVRPVGPRVRGHRSAAGVRTGRAAARAGGRGRSERPQPDRAGRGGPPLGTELGSAFRPAAGEGDAAGRDVKGVLTQQGYEPCGGADGVIRLRNCPFHQLAEQHRELVCGMNLALVEGLVEGLGADGWHPALDPRPGQCCVAIGGDRA